MNTDFVLEWVVVLLAAAGGLPSPLTGKSEDSAGGLPSRPPQQGSQKTSSDTLLSKTDLSPDWPNIVNPLSVASSTAP